MRVMMCSCLLATVSGKLELESVGVEFIIISGKPQACGRSATPHPVLFS